MKMKGSGKKDTKGIFYFFSKAPPNLLSYLVRLAFSPRTKPTAFGIA